MPGSTTFRLALPPLALLTVLLAAFCMGKFAIAPADLIRVTGAQQAAFTA